MKTNIGIGSVLFKAIKISSFVMLYGL